MEITIKVKGLDNLIKKLEKLDSKLDKSTVLEKVANKVKENAKELCPVDTGKLKSSINMRMNDNSAEIYTNVHYAPYVEFGTGIKGNSSFPYGDEIDFKPSYGYKNGQAAQPFLYPALKLAENEILEEFKQKLKE